MSHNPLQPRWQQPRSNFGALGPKAFKNEFSRFKTESTTPHHSFMELLKFKGGNPFRWFIKINKYFVLHNTPTKSMVSITSICLEGEAQGWFQDAKAADIFTNGNSLPSTRFGRILLHPLHGIWQVNRPSTCTFSHMTFLMSHVAF